MKLKEIILKSNWEAVRKALLHLYPSQNRSISGYEIVYKKLRSKPLKESSLTLCCDKDHSSLKGEDQLSDIYGTDGTKRDDGELEVFSLSLHPWAKWLGSSLSDKTLSNYSNEEIISHCLFEMTFHGFTESEIRKVKKELSMRIKDHDDPIRFIIISRLSSKWQYYFNVSDETWCSDIDSATIFKREKYALALLKLLSRKKDKTNIIAKITIKNNKRKILKYFG